jgi:sensor histidine kinase YesM
LDGAMNSWQQNENGHLVFYNIAPGNYTLHVKGSDKQVLAPAEEDVVHITVKAFWWQTRAFWLSLIAAAILLATFIIRRNIANIRRQAAFKQKLAEMEMTALRAQMNPHFIFNSLNSIENFIMQNKERQASDYLNKFARLIRIILENSLHNLIPVMQDLEALQLYVDLEQFRFHNKFSYQVCIDKELTEDNYKVPPLLIQPFVENAIVHGLANSDRSDLRLSVRVRMMGDYIHYTIEDNGVGRKRAALYQVQNRKNHRSVGLHITQERINIFNQTQTAGDEVMITDLYDEAGNAAGTRCQIKIKPV